MNAASGNGSESIVPSLRSVTALMHGLATLYITGNLPKRRLKSLVRETLGYLLEGARP